MRTITQALLALGFVGAMAVNTPNTANAQSTDLYIRGPGVGVDVQVGRRPYRYYDSRRYDRDYDGYYNRRRYQRYYYNGNYSGNGYYRYGNPQSQY